MRKEQRLPAIYSIEQPPIQIKIARTFSFSSSFQHSSLPPYHQNSSPLHPLHPHTVFAGKTTTSTSSKTSTNTNTSSVSRNCLESFFALFVARRVTWRAALRVTCWAALRVRVLTLRDLVGVVLDGDVDGAMLSLVRDRTGDFVVVRNTGVSCEAGVSSLG